MIESGIPNEIIISELLEKIRSEVNYETDFDKEVSAGQNRGEYSLSLVLRGYIKLIDTFKQIKERLLTDNYLTPTSIDDYIGVLFKIREEIERDLNAENVTVRLKGRKYSHVERAQMFWYRYIEANKHPYHRYNRYCSEKGRVSLKSFRRIVTDCSWLYENLLLRLSSREMKRILILAKGLEISPRNWGVFLARAEEALEKNALEEFLESDNG